MHTVQNYKLSKSVLVWQTGSYSNATDNFKVEKSARKSARNLQVMGTEFAIFWRGILTTLSVSVTCSYCKLLHVGSAAEDAERLGDSAVPLP